MRNEAPLKNYKISTTYNVNYEPTDQEIKEQTFYKLKNKLIIFSNKIIWNLNLKLPIYYKG